MAELEVIRTRVPAVRGRGIVIGRLCDNAAHGVPGLLVGKLLYAYEVAALALADVTTDAAFLRPVQSATGRHKLHTALFAACFCAQLTHAAEGLPRRQADGIVKQIADRYSGGVKAGRIGKPFQEAFNLEPLEPSPECQRVYAVIRGEMERDWGLQLRVDDPGGEKQ